MDYIIDLRKPEDFALGHYQGAINHEFLLIEEGLLPEYDKDAALYLYCKEGLSAVKAKIILEESGFTDVTNLGGYDPDMEIVQEQD